MSAIALPQTPLTGGCLCGEIRYRLIDIGLTLYACHCTDCQRQTGSGFSLALVVRTDSLTFDRGHPAEYKLTLADGRLKRARFCGVCSTRLNSPTRAPELTLLEASTLDDTSWLCPVAHIWTRSAQSWIDLPDDALRFEQGPEPADHIAFVRAWQDRYPSS